MKAVISHAGFGLIAVIATLLTQHYFSGDSRALTGMENVPNQPTIVSNTASDETSAAENSAFTIDESVAVLRSMEAAEEQIQDSLTNTVNTGENQHLAPPSSITEFLANTSSDMFVTGEIDLIAASFKAWFEESADPGKDIMDFLLSDQNSDEEKHVMEYLLASSSAMQTVEGLDRNLVTQLGLADLNDSVQWENIMNTVSISSPEARTELLSTLPNIENNKIVSASLLAMKPQFVSPTERSQLLTDIALYTESDSPDVQSAALMSLGQWSAQGYSHIVEDMLVNGTIDQKNSAIVSASSGNIWSDQIAHHTLSALNDTSLPIDIRHNAFIALTNHPLDDYSYEQVHHFYTSHIQPLESQN